MKSLSIFSATLFLTLPTVAHAGLISSALVDPTSLSSDMLAELPTEACRAPAVLVVDLDAFDVDDYKVASTDRAGDPTVVVLDPAALPDTVQATIDLDLLDDTLWAVVDAGWLEKSLEQATDQTRLDADVALVDSVMLRDEVAEAAGLRPGQEALMGLVSSALVSGVVLDQKLTGRVLVTVVD